MPANHAPAAVACKRCGNFATPDLCICRSCLKLLRATLEANRLNLSNPMRHVNPVAVSPVNTVNTVKPHHWAR